MSVLLPIIHPHHIMVYDQILSTNMAMKSWNHHEIMKKTHEIRQFPRLTVNHLEISITSAMDLAFSGSVGIHRDTIFQGYSLEQIPSIPGSGLSIPRTQCHAQLCHEVFSGLWVFDQPNMHKTSYAARRLCQVVARNHSHNQQYEIWVCLEMWISPAKKWRENSLMLLWIGGPVCWPGHWCFKALYLGGSHFWTKKTCETIVFCQMIMGVDAATIENIGTKTVETRHLNISCIYDIQFNGFAPVFWLNHYISLQV